jgi:uncharacterized protein (TIGR03086 family)
MAVPPGSGRGASPTTASCGSGAAAGIGQTTHVHRTAGTPLMGRSPDAPRALDGDARCVDDQYIGPVGSQSVVELIELGRDREAAELAQRQGANMDVLSQLDQLGPLLDDVVGGISADQLDNSTACAEYDVRGVLEHMIGGATVFTAAFRGAEPGEPPLADPLASFAPTIGGLFDSMRAPGALDQTIQAPFGAVPGAGFAQYVVLDGLVHGWDLATATGQSYDPPAELVAAAQACAEGMLDPMRDGTTFAQATEPPAGASPIERLAAYTGRKV